MIFKKYFIYLLLEMGEGREIKRARNINWLPLLCAPTGDRTGDFSPYRKTSSQLSHAGQGPCNYFFTLSLGLKTFSREGALNNENLLSHFWRLEV